MRSLLVATLLLGACSSSLFGIGVLSYAQVQSIRPGQTVPELVDQFGEPRDTLEKDGAVRGLTYKAEDPTGKVRELRIGLNDEGRVVRWTLGGTN